MIKTIELVFIAVSLFTIAFGVGMFASAINYKLNPKIDKWNALAGLFMAFVGAFIMGAIFGK